MRLRVGVETAHENTHTTVLWLPNGFNAQGQGLPQHDRTLDGSETLAVSDTLR